MEFKDNISSERREKREERREKREEGMGIFVMLKGKCERTSS